MDLSPGSLRTPSRPICSWCFSSLAGTPVFPSWISSSSPHLKSIRSRFAWSFAARVLEKLKSKFRFALRRLFTTSTGSRSSGRPLERGLASYWSRWKAITRLKSSPMTSTRVSMRLEASRQMRSGQRSLKSPTDTRWGGFRFSGTSVSVR